MDQPTSIFDRIFGQPRPIWVVLIVSISLLLLPIAFVYLGGALDEFFSQGRWRVFLLPPTIIIYVWLVSPLMARMGANVIESIRPLIQLDDDSVDHMIQDASRVDPLHEWIAFGIGVILGIISALSTDFDQGTPWSNSYWLLSSCLMYGVLGWTVFVSVSSTRLNAALHRQPMQFDIFNSTPFEAFGRQSLLLALVFIGGITLSLLFTIQDANLSSLEFWLVNLLFVLFIVSIFFLAMRPTHKVLLAEKKRRLEPVQRHINLACQDLVQRLDQSQDPGNLPGEINALIIYEQRLLTARTWPYNTSMLRTLFFSILIPLGSILARLAVDILLP
jgi:hypothetical protein